MACGHHATFNVDAQSDGVVSSLIACTTCGHLDALDAKVTPDGLMA